MNLALTIVGTVALCAFAGEAAWRIAGWKGWKS
jgi:hypothetical protein